MPRPLVQKKTLRDSLPIDMLPSAGSVLVVAQSSSEVPEGLMNNPVHSETQMFQLLLSKIAVCCVLAVEVRRALVCEKIIVPFTVKLIKFVQSISAKYRGNEY